MSASLGALGVDHAAERLYRLLLRHPGLDGEQLATLVGCDQGELRRAGAVLVGAGLAREAPDGGLVAGAPNVTLETVVEEELTRLEERRRHLEEVRAGIADFAAEHLAGQAEGWTSAPVDRVLGPEVRAAFEDLTRSAAGDLLIIQDVVPDRGTPWGTDVPGLFRHLSRRTRDVRCLYPVDALFDPSRAPFVRAVADQGFDVRLLDNVEHRIAVFGDAAAIVSTGEGADAVHHVVRAPELVRTLRSMFQMLWKAGVPFRRGIEEYDEERARLLELLATGLKDEAIARHLQVSLRTIRRRVAEVLDEFGASTRFQAGMEAARRRLV
jgi:DNA-binding NarL/FixJ family response regulator